MRHVAMMLRFVLPDTKKKDGMHWPTVVAYGYLVLAHARYERVTEPNVRPNPAFALHANSGL